jgi:polyisoprenoid-binding protein YceI
MGAIISDDRLRAMYPRGRADATARRLSSLWAAVFQLGLMPRRWVTLEVAGRRSGRVTRFPLGMADWNGQHYLVPFLGERCNWVQNVRAADGVATLRRRRAVRCRLVEVPVSERPPIIKRYLEQVPGARPHIPVDRRAPVAEFEAVAERYPVFRVVPAASAPGLATPAGRREPTERVRRRHWWRWILGGAVMLVVLIAAAAGLIFKLQPSPAPLALPTGAAAAPAGPLDGSWEVAAGSLAAFRVPESALGMSNDTVGRTSDVSGTVLISGETVTSATIRVNLATVKVGGKQQPQFTESLGTAAHPFAVLTLTRPVNLSSAFASGATVTVRAEADLAMHGASHAVPVTFSARRDGPALQAAGSIAVTFSEWGIRGPAGFGFIASLANHGSAEFFLVLHRS